MRKILIGDDHAILRIALKKLIGDFIPHSEIEEADDSNSIFEKISDTEFDLIILDINIPENSQRDLIKDILDKQPEAKILIFSLNDEEMYARTYLQLGVMGYLNKNTSEAEIKIAIDNILNNKKYLSASLIQRFTEDEINNKACNPFSHLSPREFEVVKHLINGESTSGISGKLSLQPSTISTFKTRIFEKLKCSNIIELKRLCEFHKLYIF